MNKALLLTLTVLTLAVIALIAATWRLYHRSGASGPSYHVRTEFEFTVQAPYAVAAPLFGPEGERAWASDSWNPHFVYPQPARDVEGAVFQVSHGHRHSTWVNTAFDLEHGHIQYVYMIPEMMVTVIDLNLSKLSASAPSAESTHVRVAYERTALNADMDEHVREFSEADRKNGKVWGEDIERYLVNQRSR
jgi:hypothetical protein